MSGYRRINTFTTYGFPFYWIRCNLNVFGSYSYTETPGMLLDQCNTTYNNSLNGGLSLASNISCNLDFRLSYSVNYNIINTTIQSDENSNYYSNNTGLTLDFYLTKRCVIRSDITYTSYVGLSDSYNDGILLWNPGLAYKFLKNNAGELEISVYDLLNQNKNISRNITTSYIEDTYTNMLKQYFFVKFSYKIWNVNSDNNDFLIDH